MFMHMIFELLSSVVHVMYDVIKVPYVVLPKVLSEF
jgi:hypothetical protein